MARCPGSEKVRATVASAIQGSRSGCCHDGLVTPERSVSGQDAGGYRGRSQTDWSCRAAEEQMGNWFGRSSMAVAGNGLHGIGSTLPAVPDPAAESIGNGSHSSALLYLVHTRLRRVPAARTLQRIRPTLRACCAAQQHAGCGLGLPRAGCCAELAMQWCSASRLGRRSM